VPLTLTSWNPLGLLYLYPLQWRYTDDDDDDDRNNNNNNKCNTGATEQKDCYEHVPKSVASNQEGDNTVESAIAKCQSHPQ
jgi:hypothetical protein